MRSTLNPQVGGDLPRNTEQYSATKQCSACDDIKNDVTYPKKRPGANWPALQKRDGKFQLSRSNDTWFSNKNKSTVKDLTPNQVVRVLYNDMAANKRGGKGIALFFKDDKKEDVVMQSASFGLHESGYEITELVGEPEVHPKSEFNDTILWGLENS